MIGFPHAKINLGLSIISKRTDGFHDLESVFYPLPFREILELIPAGTTSLSESGVLLTGDPADNLVLRAYHLIKKNFPQVPPVAIYLHKAIPSGAGLGGGSADAACMLQLMNDLFSLGLSTAELQTYALMLGSDCAFFLQSAPCLVRGRGEVLEPISLDLGGYSILLVNPGIPVSTAWAFTQIQPAASTGSWKTVITEPVKNWRGRLLNDFELPVFRQFPELAAIKARLYEAGALYAALTGSGSSIYGIFEKNRIPETGIAADRQLWLP